MEANKVHECERIETCEREKDSEAGFEWEKISYFPWRAVLFMTFKLNVVFSYFYFLLFSDV